MYKLRMYGVSGPKMPWSRGGEMGAGEEGGVCARCAYVLLPQDPRVEAAWWGERCVPIEGMMRSHSTAPYRRWKQGGRRRERCPSVVSESAFFAIQEERSWHGSTMQSNSWSEVCDAEKAASMRRVV